MICGRDFIFSPLAQSLSITYAQKSDGGAVDMKSRKTMPEDASISRTAVHIAGKYLFTYQGSALDEYFKQTKSPSQKVINLLRLALVPSITANREMFQLLKGLQFQEEVPIQFPSKFIDEFEAESDERYVQKLEMVKHEHNREFAPIELIIKRLKESNVWELGDELDNPFERSLKKNDLSLKMPENEAVAREIIRDYHNLRYNLWWAIVKIEDGTLVRANDDDDDDGKINIVLIEDELENYGRLAVSYVDEYADVEDLDPTPFYNSGLLQKDDGFDFGDMGEFYHVYWGDLVRHDCAANADLDIYEDDLIMMECNTCGRTSTFRQETPYEGPRNAETLKAESFEDMKIKYENRDRIFFIKSVDYDTDGEIENDKLPQEFTIKIPSDYHYFEEDADEGDITDVLNEWISTETGFTTKGIVWIEEENNSWLKNAESVLASVKSAETIDQAQAVLSNYSGQGMMAENLQYLNSIISYDYGSGKNAEFEVYGVPTLQDVQKFAEGLVNIQRFLGE